MPSTTTGELVTSLRCFSFIFLLLITKSLESALLECSELNFMFLRRMAYNFGSDLALEAGQACRSLFLLEELGVEKLKLFVILL